MRRFLLLTAILALFLTVVFRTTAAQLPPEDTAWQAKVDAWVLETADPALAPAGAPLPQTEFLVLLAEQADVSGARQLPTKAQKGQYVFDTLTAVANRTQPAVMAQLDALGVAYRPFWVVNMIWAQGDITAVQAMAERADVARILANPTVPMQFRPTTPAQMNQALQTIEWNISHVGAPDVWAAGVTGAGVVIGGQDTGYDWDHPGLINQYRGWNGASADHNYNWHDSIHSGGGVCGADSPEPCDDHGHGTHTMGTMVGNDLDPADPSWPAGATNAVGMAPGARWIGCRNMDVGNGTPATYTECYQWFIAPTDLNGQNPNPALAPHVINNSWSCPGSEGCSQDTLLAVVQNVVAAGIVTVHSAGNGGSACGTVNAPAATYDESFSVGATNSSDTIAGFSSRGPSTYDNGRKPDISAPGVNIRSTIRGGGYQGGWNGTSMAAPHVAGLVGLLISAEPALAGQVALIEDQIEQTAVPRTTNDGCGGDGPTDVPNHTYGHGRIDAFAATMPYLPHSFTVAKTAPAPTVFPGESITYTITVEHLHPVSVTNNLVLTDVIPAGTTFVTATQPFSFDGTTVTWNSPSLGANASWDVSLVVSIPVSSTMPSVTNADYAARSDEVETTAGPPVETTVLPLDHHLQVTGAVSDAAIRAGDPLTYTFTVSHTHPGLSTTNVILTNTLPANVTFITATHPFTFDGQTVRWETPSLLPVDSWQVTLVVGTVPTHTTTAVTNSLYAVSSDDVALTMGTEPLTTTLWPSHQLYLAFIKIE